jgi:preprotein translocase subunit YajC
VWDKVQGDKSIQEKLKGRTLFGQAEHPKSVQSDLQLTSHIITDFIINEDEGKLYQNIDILDTPCGQIINTLIEAGCQVGVSTRAEGDLVERTDDQGTYHEVVPEAYRYVSTDFTADPSTFGTKPMNLERSQLVHTLEGVAQSGKLNENEKRFAQKLIESIQSEEGVEDDRNEVDPEELAKEEDKNQQTLEKQMEQELKDAGLLPEGLDLGCKIKTKDGKIGTVKTITESAITVMMADNTTITVDDFGTITVIPNKEEPVEEPIDEEPIELDVEDDYDGDLDQDIEDVRDGEEGEEIDMDLDDEDLDEGKKKPGKRDKTGPYKRSMQAKTSKKDKRKQAGGKCSMTETLESKLRKKNKINESEMNASCPACGSPVVRGDSDSEYEWRCTNCSWEGDDPIFGAPGGNESTLESKLRKKNKINENQDILFKEGDEVDYHGRTGHVVMIDGGSVIVSFEDTGEEEAIDIDELAEQNDLVDNDEYADGTNRTYESKKKTKKRGMNESFGNMVDFLEKAYNKLSNTQKAKVNSIVGTNTISERKPTIIAKELRKLKIQEASIRAERDKTIELLKQAKMNKLNESKNVSLYENKVNRLNEKISKANESIERYRKGYFKVLEDKKKYDEKLKKAIQEQKENNTRILIKEYVNLKLDI